MSESNNEFDSSRVDIRLLGISEPRTFHRYKAIIITVILIIIFVVIAIFIGRAYVNGYESNKGTIIACGAIEFCIIIIYFKLIHKHMPARGYVSKFTGDAAIVRQKQALFKASQLKNVAMEQQREKAVYESELVSKHMTEIEQFKHDNKIMRQELKRAHQWIMRMQTECMVP
jgi:hypothetical protein